MKRVTSRQNVLVARYKAIARGSDRRSILLDGPHLVADALRAAVVLRHVVVTAAGMDRGEVKALVAALERRDVEIVSASPPVMAALSPLRSSSDIVAIADRPDHSGDRLYAAAAPLVVIACDVQDPGNLGAIVRVAEAAGASGVAAAGACADPFGWKALRGSMGSALRLPIVIVASAAEAIAEARRHGCRVVATVSRDGRPLFEFDLKQAAAILVGGEGRGLAQPYRDTADERVTVPMEPPVESLNTAVAAAIVLYEARRQRHAGA